MDKDNTNTLAALTQTMREGDAKFLAFVRADYIPEIGDQVEKELAENDDAYEREGIRTRALMRALQNGSQERRFQLYEPMR
jgi:hypothetical protein